MNRVLKLVLYYYLVAIVLALVYFVFSKGTDNEISRANRHKRQARQAYLDARYKEAFYNLSYLADSLGAGEEEIDLNRAHAGYMLSRSDSSNLLGTLLNNPDQIDSATRHNMKEKLDYAQCLAYYQALSGSAEDNKIASVAFNQLGVITYRFRDQEAVEKEEAALVDAADHFRSALVKFPENDVARFNYELIRRKIDYPEMIIGRVRSLIAQHKYREARELLKKGLQKDRLIERKYKDYVDRIENIIRIDSLFQS